MTGYRVWEYSNDVSMEWSGRSGDLSIDQDGSIDFSCYGGTWVGDFHSGADLTLEDAIELSVLLTSRIIPHLMEKENEIT